MDAGTIQRALARMAAEVAERNAIASEVVLIGIQRGGAQMAHRLAAELGRVWRITVPIGTLDVTMHRDDLDQRSAPAIYPTVIPFDITGKTVVLVDDVLFSGRTTRAALDALHDFGRPRRVQLAVLVDRGQRELPVNADFAGRVASVPSGQRVVVKMEDDPGLDAVYIQQP